MHDETRPGRSRAGKRAGSAVTASGLASVAVGGSVTGSITTNVFVGHYVGLRAAWLDPAMIFADVRVSRFVGRKWLIQAIDDFVSTNDHGYIVIEADAGMGKTSLAAHLAADRGYPAHFSAHLNGGVASVALRNIAAQLIAAWHLDNFAEGGLLPDASGEPAWLERLLRAAGESALAADQRAVVIVDGLDEAPTAPGALPFGLPRLLPPGVIIIVTCRTGTPLAGLVHPYRMLPISLDDSNNLADIREFLIERMEDADLAADTKTTGQCIDEISSRSRGVWIYVRCLVDELAAGQRHLDELDGIPDGLGEYYRQAIAPLRADATWATQYLPLLATLAAAQEPISLDSLSRLAGIDQPEAAHRLCYGRIRSFLTVHAAPDGPQFSLLHKSFREFLAGQRSGAVTAYGEDLAGELTAAARLAHRRIADFYLGHFGGLERGMPELARDLGRTAVDHGYALRHLALHLEASGREPELHRLLSCQWRDFEGRDRNIWFEAQDFSGNLGEYLLDIERARAVAVRESDAQLTAGIPAGSFVLELRYGLMEASVDGLVGYVPPVLLARLVATGHWSVEKALSWARRLEWSLRRAEAYSMLLPYVAFDSRPSLIQLALDELVANKGYLRARVIDNLRPYLSSGQVRTLWEFALRDLDDGTLLFALARELPPELIKGALALLEEGRFDDRLAARLMETLADRLSDSLVASAWETALKMGGERRLALAALIPRLPPEDLNSIYDGLTESDDDFPLSLRAAIAIRLTGRRREEAIAAAYSAAMSAGVQISVIAILAPCLSPDLLRDAVLSAAHAYGSAQDAMQLSSLRDYVSEELAAEAITVLRQKGNEWHYGAAALLPAAAPELQRDMGTVLASSLARRDHGPYSPLLLLLLRSNFPPEAMDELIGRAFAEADDLDVTSLIAVLAPYLRREHIVMALDRIAAIGKGEDYNPESRSQLESLEHLAQFLPADLIPQAVACAARLKDGDAFADASISMAPYLDPAGRAELISRALRWAPVELPDFVTFVDLAEPVSWEVVLERVAPYLSEEELPMALDAWGHITRSYPRISSLRAMAARLSPDLAARARQQVGGWEDAYSRAMGLICLLPQKTAAESAALADDVLRAIHDIADDRQRLKAIGQALARLDRARAEQTIRDIEAVTSPMTAKVRCNCLADVVSVASGAWQERLLKLTLDAVTQLEAEADRAAMIEKLARYLTDGLAEQAVTITCGLAGNAFRRAARAVIRRVPNRVLSGMCAAAVDDPAAYLDILPFLVSRATTDVSSRLLAPMMTLVEQDPDRFPWRDGIKEVGAHLSAGQLEAMVTAADRISDANDRIAAQVALIRYLPRPSQNQLLDIVFEAIPELDEPRENVHFLSDLVRFRPDLLDRSLDTAEHIGWGGPADVIVASASALTAISPSRILSTVSAVRGRHTRLSVIRSLAPISAQHWSERDITGLLRLAVSPMPRATILRCIASAPEIVVRVAGRSAARECVDSMVAVQSWYR